MSKYTSFLPQGNEEVEETLNFKRIAIESYSDSIAERHDPHGHLKSHLSRVSLTDIQEWKANV